MLTLLFKAFDNRDGLEVTALAFTLHRGNLEAWPEGRLVARQLDNQWGVDGVLWVESDAIAALKDGRWASMSSKQAWPKLRLAFSSDDG